MQKENKRIFSSIMNGQGLVCNYSCKSSRFKLIVGHQFSLFSLFSLRDFNKLFMNCCSLPLDLYLRSFDRIKKCFNQCFFLNDGITWPLYSLQFFSLNVLGKKMLLNDIPFLALKGKKDWSKMEMKRENKRTSFFFASQGIVSQKTIRHFEQK